MAPLRPRVAWRIPGAALTVVLVAVLTLPASAQEGEYGPGLYEFAEGAGPVVSAGETLRILAGARMFGSGNLTVQGTLIVEGAPGNPAEFSIPVRILEGGRAELRHARLWGVNATALEVDGGLVHARDTLIEANTRAALVRGRGVFEASDTVFRDHAGEALYVEGAATVHLARATFSGNGRGATVYSARELHVNDSLFVANAQHLVIDLGPWSVAGADLLLARDRFEAPAPTPAQLPSIVLRHDAPFVDAGEERLVRLESNRVSGAPVGLRIEGRGLAIESTNDTFVDNDVGLSVQLSTVRLARPTLGNVRDIDGSGRVSVLDATYQRVGAPAVEPEDARAPWLPWAIGAGVLVLVALAALVAPRLARRAPAPPPEPEPAPPPAPSPASAPGPDLGAPISATERRILEDIRDHPGTAQRAVADRLGYTRQALHYHVKKLEARGLVTKTVEGRETRCEVPPAVASLLDATRTRTEEKA